MRNELQYPGILLIDVDLAIVAWHEKAQNSHVFERRP